MAVAACPLLVVLTTAADYRYGACYSAAWLKLPDHAMRLGCAGVAVAILRRVRRRRRRCGDPSRVGWKSAFTRRGGWGDLPYGHTIDAWPIRRLLGACSGLQLICMPAVAYAQYSNDVAVQGCRAFTSGVRFRPGMVRPTP